MLLLFRTTGLSYTVHCLTHMYVSMFIISILGIFITWLVHCLCVCVNIVQVSQVVWCVTCKELHVLLYTIGWEQEILTIGSFPCRLICALEASTLPHTFVPITLMTWDMNRYTLLTCLLKIISQFVTQSWETVPNHASGKYKLTPPAFSHTTVVLVSSLNFGLLTQGWL